MRGTMVSVGMGVVVTCLQPIAVADSYSVPGDFSTIQEAIDGVLDGDEILVAAGTYNEALNPGTKSITIRGSIDKDGVPTTIVDGGELAAIRIVDNSSTELRIENLEIRGDAYWSISRGGGIYCADSQPTIQNCVFHGCTALSGSYNLGGGLYVLAQNSDLAPTIIDCVFRQNQAERGGAIYFYRHTSSSVPVVMQISGSLFEDNSASEGGGGIFMYGQAGVALNSCIIRNNQTGGFGGGIENASALSSLYGCSLCAPDTGGYGQLVQGSGWLDLGFNCLTTDCMDSDGDDRPDHCDQCDGPDLDDNGNGWADCAELDNGDGTMTWQVRAGTQIQPAVHISSEGDTIKLASGTFDLDLNQSVDLSDVGVRLSGTVDGSGAPATVINSVDAATIWIDSNASPQLAVENIELHGNSFWSISRGGGIYCADSQPTIQNCIFDGCSANNGSYNLGGGMYVLSQYADLVPTLIDCIFTQNLAEKGGAIHFYRHTNKTEPVIMSVSGCFFLDNEGPEGGGAIFMYGQAGMALSSCVFENNKTVGFNAGGGIENASSLTSFYGCSLCAPDTTTYGQLVKGIGWIDLGFNCLTHDCTDSDEDDRPDHCDQCDGPDLDENSNGWADCAELDNGDGTMTWYARAGTQIQPAVHISNEGDTIKLGPGVFNLELNQSIDLSNVGVRLCGTVDESGTPVTMINSFDASTIWITDNASEYLGVENLELHGNSYWSVSRGGGIYCADSRPSVYNVVFDGCAANNGSYNFGGGLYVLAQFTSLVPNLTHCFFRQNEADKGGAIYFYRHTSSSDPVTMSISTTRFEENLAPDGGGAIFMYGAAGVDLDVCLFKMNAAPDGDAGGLENAFATATSIRATIFCAPTTDNYYGQHIKGTWADLGSNCFTDDCTDSDGDGIPDDCEFSECPEDVDDDGFIGGADLAVLLGNWGPCPPRPTECTSDLNGDGGVDGADLSLLLGAWGACDG